MQKLIFDSFTPIIVQPEARRGSHEGFLGMVSAQVGWYWLSLQMPGGLLHLWEHGEGGGALCQHHPEEADAQEWGAV